MSTEREGQQDPIDLINTDLLPPNLRLLCRVLGGRKAFALCKARGGVPLQVPRRPRVEHWLIEHIGYDGLQALVAELGGVLIDVPKHDKMLQQLQHMQVHACLMSGLGPTTTALRTGYTKRHVLNIKASLQHATGERYTPPGQSINQQDMFADLLQPGDNDDQDDALFDEMEQQAVAEQEGGVLSIDDDHRDMALASSHGAHNPFGITKPPR